MIPASDLLLEFLETLRGVTGAESAALLLHMEPPDRQSMLLTRCDAGEVVPELANETAAWDFITSRQGYEPDEATPITFEQSTDAEGVLVRVALSKILVQPQATRREIDERRGQPDIRTSPAIDGVIWIGLKRATDVLKLTIGMQSGGEQPGDGHDWFGLYTSLSLKLAWSVYHFARMLQDPVGQLPGHMEFQVFLKRAISAARDHEQAIGVLLVNPDDFTMINHRHGRSQGDQAIREIAEQLAVCLRSTDGIFRYGGGAVFGAVLPATDLDQCRAVTEKVRRHLAGYGYVDGTVRLTFSIGATVAQPGELAADGVEVDLIKHTDEALNIAKLSGGSRVILTGMDDSGGNGAPLAPLNGIFTANTEKDYRNMLLLWETVALVSAHPEPEAMASAFVDRLAISFQPDRAALFSNVDGEIKPLAVNVRDDSSTNGRAGGHSINLDKQCSELVLQAVKSERIERINNTETKSGETVAYAVPLIARNVTIGCLYLDATGRRLQLDSSDLIFLNALASQMAVALDRSDLAARWIREKDREGRRLRKEVRDLRQALHHTKMIYQSSAMHSVMETLRKVAPTDATVLVVGESGTGKEMLAQAIHEMSDRREAPFIVFDCSAVAHSLLEAELFGHVKGAFTGAENSSEGSISLADGGTLCLDEIGELPLQVQAKLLRFVQEKEFSPIGSAQTRKVDVRIIAVTNRELQHEVGAGRFRADLYYRLRVIAVQAIPLRQRTDDILPLAHYFLEKFTAQYGGPTRRFSPSAEQRLLQYYWPGNVRELQHCVLRAVLTHDKDVIDADAIELYPDSGATDAVASNEISEAEPHTMTALPHNSSSALEGSWPLGHAAETADVDNPWDLLCVALHKQIELAMSQNKRRPVPLGRWLREDLVLTASDMCDNVALRAAQLIGVPESTFRRQLEKTTAGAAIGLDFRAPDWESVRPLIRQVVEGAMTNQNGSELNILERARMTLLEGVHIAAIDSPTAGAALMGVTPPTYKRWVQAREHRTL